MAITDYQIGDTIYFQRNGSIWSRKVVVGVTSVSYQVVDQQTWDVYKGRVPSWVPDNCLKIPKSGKRGEETYTYGTQIDYERQRWSDRYKRDIIQQLDWATRWGAKSDVLYGVACVLGLEEVIKAYPFPEIILPEVKHEKQSAGNSSGDKAADANGSGKA